MDLGTATTAHHEYEELLAPAALGALRAEEHAMLMAHLRTCASCRETLGRLLSAADALPLTVQERAPSDALRERLRARIGPEPAARTIPSAPPMAGDDRGAPIPLGSAPGAPLAPDASRQGRRTVTWLLAAAALLLLGLVGGVLIDRLVLDGEDTGDVQEIALQSPAGLELESARLEYLEAEGIVRFAAPDLPQPPEGLVYQAWLIAGEDAPPEPAGVIDPTTGEVAAVVDAGRHGMFAVTVEPGPLGSAAPTTDPVIVAELPEPSTG